MRFMVKAAAPVGFALLVSLWSAHSVAADPITFAYAGVVTDIRKADFFPISELGAGPIAPGVPVTGRFTYDPTARPDELIPQINFVLFNSAPARFDLSVGLLRREKAGLGFRSDSGAIFPRFGLGPVDGWGELSAVLFPGRPFRSFPAVPTERDILNSFEPGLQPFRIELGPEDDSPVLSLNGRLTSLDVVSSPAVPEPLSVLLFAPAALTLAAREWRTRKKAEAPTTCRG
jgi:hypothetical protein